MREPFPGTREGRPFGTFALIWALPEEHRREIAWIELGDDATLRARGRQWSSLDPPGYALEYELDTSPGYVTERLHVSVAHGPELTLTRGESPELDGIADCDLGFSPLTNAMPVLRDRLDGSGEQFEIDVAWVSVPDLAVHRDHQIYEPKGERHMRFSSPEADFERIIALTHGGFVLDYPEIARLVTTIVRLPLDAVDGPGAFPAVVAAALELPADDIEAWTQCLAQCDKTLGGCRYEVPPGTTLTLQLDGLASFAERCPARLAELVGVVAEVNRRRSENGEPAVLALTGSGYSAVVSLLHSPTTKGEAMPDADVDTEAEFRAKLTPQQYEILRRRGTERPFSGEYVYSKDSGMYKCAACGAELFSSDTKFDSGTGWPSFTEPANAAAVNLIDDSSHGMKRTEVTCKNCGSHLGHVFPDGPREAGGQRYCINSLSLQLEPDDAGQTQS